MNTESNTNNKMTECRYCKNKEINGHVIANCPVLKLKNVRIALQTKIREEAKATALASALAKIKCHWCNKYGHYKSECKEMAFFISEGERVRNEQRQEYDTQFPLSIPTVLTTVLSTTVLSTTVLPIASTKLKFAWASVALSGISRETINQNFKEDNAARRVLSQIEYKKKKMLAYEAKQQKKEDERARWPLLKPVIDLMKQAFPNSWQDKLENTDYDTREAVKKRSQEFDKQEERDRRREIREVEDEDEYQQSYEKAEAAYAAMTEEEKVQYNIDLDDDFDGECANQGQYEHYYEKKYRTVQKSCQGCDGLTEQDNQLDFCVPCIFTRGTTFPYDPSFNLV
jgi:hypothetical protein